MIFHTGHTLYAGHVYSGHNHRLKTTKKHTQKHITTCKQVRKKIQLQNAKSKLPDKYNKMRKINRKCKDKSKTN